MVLQGLIGQGRAPAYSAAVTYKMSCSFDKEFGVDLPDSFRRFPIYAGQVIKDDPRYASRALKIYKAPFEKYEYVEYKWNAHTNAASIPVECLPSTKPFMQTNQQEEAAFAHWYETGIRAYELISWEYQCGNFGLGDILMRGRKSGTYYCLEIKKNERGQAVWIQAWKYALFIARTLKIMGRHDRVVPCVLVGDRFLQGQSVTEMHLLEYNKGRQIWYDLGRWGELPEEAARAQKAYIDRKNAAKEGKSD